MTATRASQRAVFRQLSREPYYKWPTYDLTPLYDRSSLGALEEDVQYVGTVWFEHAAHESIKEFVCRLPLAYVEFDPHDCYASTTGYEMEPLFRTFLLKELHGWTHETALVDYLQETPRVRQQLGFESLPDQSTLWRTWHQRFTAYLRETIQTAARTILIKAADAGVSLPRELPNTPSYSETADEPQIDEQTLLERSAEISGQISRTVYPAFSLQRDEECEIHENAFRDLQTYLGLRENLAVNEGARSFVLESQRERTPLGHAHWEHIRNLSIPDVREMYRTAIERLLDLAAATTAFHRAGYRRDRHNRSRSIHRRSHGL